MDTLRFVPASELSLQDLTAAFNHAFEGYFVPMSHTPASLTAMFDSYDISLASSLVMYAGGAEPAGAVLLAIRDGRGWVGGMGIVPAWRGQRLGGALLTRLIAQARAAGLRTVQLEVLEQNIAARRLYTQAGFRETRPLAVYGGTLALDAIPAIATDGHDVTSPVAVDTVLAAFDSLHTVPSPWQRESDSLARMAHRLQGYALYDAAGLRADLLVSSSPGGFTVQDFGSRAPDDSGRIQDAALLLQALVRESPDATVRAVNVPPGDALGEALAQLRCPLTNTQREMILDLSEPREG